MGKANVNGINRMGVVYRDIVFFFFQAEDGIRDHCVTGVQTCALPISNSLRTGKISRRELAPGSAEAGKNPEHSLIFSLFAGNSRARKSGVCRNGAAQRDRKSVV